MHVHYPVTVMLRRVLTVCATVAALFVIAGCSPVRADSTSSHSPSVIRVPADAASLAEAAERVEPGDTIVIAPGHYAEQILIDTPDVTIRGEDRNATVIDGDGIRPYGIVVIADGVRVENLTVTGATFYGVLFTGLHDENGPSAPTADSYEQWDPAQFPPLERFSIDHVTAYNNGLYGLYAFNSRHGVIQNSYASGSADSGIYIGQCTECDILVTGNVAERNAVGFENSNASDSVVIAGNRFANNRIGMTLLSTYQEAFTPQRLNHVVGNLIADNDEPATPAQANGAFATGIGISGGQENLFERNLIVGHARAGVIFTNTEDLPAIGNRFIENVFTDNEVDAANTSAERTPASANCVTGLASSDPAQLVEQVAAACAGSSEGQAATTALTLPPEPPGLSFKKVPPPRDQPGFKARSNFEKLPREVAMPDLSQFSVPDRSLLSPRAGSR